MSQDFLKWWAARMIEMLPAKLAAAARGRSKALTISALGPLHPLATVKVDVILNRRSAIHLGRFLLDDAGVQRLAGELRGQNRNLRTVLLLPEGTLLDRQVALPLAAERDPQRILGYEMDRLTPFRPDEIYWTWQLEDRNQKQGRLRLRLWLVPRVTLRPLLAELQRAGVVPTSLSPANDGDSMLRISLLSCGVKAGAWWRSGWIAMAFACAVLAVAVAATPFVQQTLASNAIEHNIAQLHPFVTEIYDLRRRIALSSADIDVISAEQIRLGDPLRVLAAVTESLPDDTFLTDFEMHQGRIEITGESAQAAKLISALATGPVIRDAEFAASVNRSQNSPTDIFSIHAEVAK